MVDWKINMTKSYKISGVALAMLANEMPNEDWANDIVYRVTQNPIDKEPELHPCKCGNKKGMERQWVCERCGNREVVE